jgi:hypothetical protein
MLKERWEDMTRAGRDWAVVTVLTLTPLLLAVVRLYIFSRGDPETVTALLVNLNLISFIASSLVAFLPYGLLAVAAWFAFRPILNVESFITDAKPAMLRGSWRVAGVVALTLLGLPFGSPVAGIVVLITGATVAAGVIALRQQVLNRVKECDESTNLREATRGPRWIARAVVAYTLTAYALVAVVFLFGIGYPTELVRVREESNLSVGYVLSVDDVSLTLAYAKGGIRRIPSSDVEERILCPVGDAELDTVVLGRAKTVAQIIFAWAAPRPNQSPPTHCTTPASLLSPAYPTKTIG